MTIWLDAHFGSDLALWISSTFKIATRTLTELDLAELSDENIFAAAGRFRSIILFTKDSDFVDLLSRHGSPPQVIWLRCPNLRTIRLQSVLKPRMPEALRQIEAGLPLVEIVIATVL